MRITIGYLEKPAGADEENIAKVFQNAATALEESDFSLFSSLYSENASVSMGPNNGAGRLNKSGFIKWLTNAAPAIRRIEYKDARIRTIGKGDSEGELFCLCVVTRSGETVPLSFYRRFGFAKEDGNWRISSLSLIDF